MLRWRFLLVLLLIAQEVSLEDPKPHLKLSPSSVQKSLGEALYISCEANVTNPDLVSEMRWFGPDGAEIPSIDGSVKVLEAGIGENRLELLIEKLRSDHTGTYNCSAIYAGNQPLNAHIVFKPHRGIDFQDTELVQKPIKGIDAKIKCHVSSEPHPIVDWLKDGRPFKGDDRALPQSDGILIKSINEQDEGVYRCRARVPQLGEIDFRDIQVEVMVKPRFTGPPQNISGVEKESATFDCVATGKPPPKYQWTTPDNEPIAGKEGYYVDEIQGSLTIIPLAPHHSGSYRCTASNDAGDVTAEAKLTVFTQPKIEEHRNHTISVGKTIEMKCILTGEPLPVAIFQKEVLSEPFVNGVNQDNRIEVSQEIENGRRVGILKIHDVKRSDDGLYTCTGNSSGGHSVSWNHLTVEFPPNFDDQPQDEFWSWEEKAVNVTCLATSIPNATVQWYLHNDPIPTNSPNLKVLSLGPNAVLQVIPTGLTYFAEYRCVASNPIGTAEHTVRLSQVRKPGPVSSTEVDKVTATTIAWNIRDPVDNGGRPVLGFNVQYRAVDMGWDQAQNHYWPKGSSSSYILDQLVPNTEYIFRFSARNDVGDGEWSGEKGEIMPTRSAPEEPFIYNADANKITSIPYTDKYEIQWHVPLDNGEPIDHFQIRYYLAQNSSSGWKAVGQQETVTIKAPGDSRFKLENLTPDSFYKIELRAHNKLGYSTPGEMIFRTAYDPSYGPGNAAPNAISSNYQTTPNAQTDAVGSNTSKDPSGIAGLAVTISLVVIIIVLITLDIIFYVTKNKGLTAFIMTKIKGDSAKDKEAMLEDGVNSSKVEVTEKTETKAVPEKDEAPEVTETTPMIVGETDKEKIQKEEQQHQQKVDVDDEKPEETKDDTKDSSV